MIDRREVKRLGFNGNWEIILNFWTGRDVLPGCFFFLRFKPRMTGFGQSERSFALLDLLLCFRVNQDIVEMDGERWSKYYFT